MKPIRTLKLGELLVNAGAISPANLQAALGEQKVSHMRLGEVLIKNGYLTEMHLAEALSAQLGIPFISLVKERPNQNALSMIPENVAARLNVIPLSLTYDGRITVAMSDPMDTLAIDEINMLTNREVDIRIATASDINKALSSYYRVQSSVEDAVQDVMKQTANISGSTQIMSQMAPQDIATVNTDDAPVVRLVNSILEQSVKEKASDIHIEPSDSTTSVRMRIDGMLFLTTEIPKNLHMPLIARIKILAGMDIAEKRRPQDGRILIKVSGKKMDMRVSTLPSIFGEKAVLRLLDQDNEHIGIEKLGFEHDQAEKLKQVVTAPHGIILVTGPTGSGKSTTLYSLLELINKPEVNIITIEDPVEYTIAGITQIQVNEKIDVTFGSALRSILRQDPDKLMVGEIRDQETAHLAVRVALTGHLVLSTLHTNDAPASINRLVDMGVPNFLIASSLRCIVAQRLVRKLCNNCKKEIEVTEEMSADINIPAGTKIFSPVGCASCRFTGHSGRTVIAELMVIDPNLRELINNARPQQEIKDYAVKNGMSTLRDVAMKKVLDGTISVEEMLITTMFD
ncbi:MAG: Flp pilus assembly complex ATPase component TadA [Synergistaceae bacterium]|nr:Flp pilus assembly complex ATPase component TadA [Synergistaceae bacterium]